MHRFFNQALRAVAVLACAVAAPLHANSLDNGFDPGADASVHALAQQADGKLLAAGDFNTVAGNTRQRFARLNADGTLDETFAPSLTGIRGIAARQDGKVVVAGDFAGSLARLDAAGAVDATFVAPAIDAPVTAVAAQADGKLVIAGAFHTVGGAARNGFARLAANGALDAAFTVPANVADDLAGKLNGIAVQADGKFIVAGTFTQVGSVARRYVARLNADGTLDGSFNPDPDAAVHAVSIQADGAVLVAGGFAQIGGAARARIARLRLDGSLDATFAVAADADVRAVVAQADGAIALGGDFAAIGAAPRARLARVDADGTLESPFIAGLDPVYPGTDPAWGVWDRVRAMAPQPDGSVVIGGSFTWIGTTPIEGLARLRRDGALDASFTPPAVRADMIVTQPDGKLIIAGHFATVDGQARPGLVRLSRDGVLDAAFAPVDWSGGGTSPTVTAVALRPDGKIVVSGYSFADNRARSVVFRLNADGSADDSFARPVITSEGGSVASVTLDNDGGILLVGRYSTVNGTPREGIARLHPDGALDTGFNAGADYDVMVAQRQADGRIVIGGHFSTINGEARPYLARLLPDGALDPDFNPPAPDGGITSVVIAADGSIVAGGLFSQVGEDPRGHIARFDANGALDANFAPDADEWVMSLATQADGKLLVAGGFLHLDGVERNHFARLAAPNAAVQRVDANGNGARWALGGSAPQYDRTTLEYSDDGTLWHAPLAGVAGEGAWSFTGALPTSRNVWLRLRGYASGGFANSGRALHETVRLACPAAPADGIFANGFDAAR